jgi:hypothetical protein
MASEQTSLMEQVESLEYDSILPVEQALTKSTPLPKLQLFSILYIQFSEPITTTVIYPFIIQLIRDTGITGGDEAKTGYYSGFIVSNLSIYLRFSLFNTSAGIYILCCRGLDSATVGSFF